MNTMLAFAILLAQELPQDAKTVISKADAKVDVLRKQFEDAVAKVRAQELRDLQRIHDAIEKGDPGAAALIKAKIDALASEVSASVKGLSGVDQWLQGKWIVTFQGSGDVMEFKNGAVIGSGIGDRSKGKYTIDGGTVQIVWDSGYVETMKVSKTFGDETTGSGRSGTNIFKRMK